jgi:hypothetical protein
VAEVSVADAEAWWGTCSPARKVQVFRWLNPGKGMPVPVPGQLSLVELAPDPQAPEENRR